MTDRTQRMSYQELESAMVRWLALNPLPVEKRYALFDVIAEIVEHREQAVRSELQPQIDTLEVRLDRIVKHLERPHEIPF